MSESVGFLDKHSFCLLIFKGCFESSDNLSVRLCIKEGHMFCFFFCLFVCLFFFVVEMPMWCAVKAVVL